jgi:NAD(P)H dehydrogenase (quinone)
MDPIKQAVIVGHPNPDSFIQSVAETYCDALRKQGHHPIMRDLYKLGFDPCLKAGEIPRRGFAPADDVKAERELIGEAEVFVFIYPLWFNAPPAIIKGYVDRVFTMGFGYGPIAGGGNQPLLGGKRMLSFTSSGAPTAWFQQEGGLNALETLFDQHLAHVCGLSVVDHVHFGGITADLPESYVQNHLQRVRDTAERLF